MRNDPTYGLHFPYLVGAAQLYSNGPDGGPGASITGSLAAQNPVLLPTLTTYPDPSMPVDGGLGVRLAWEDPTAHQDQTWTVDYEGVLASFQNLEGDISLTSAAEAPPYWALQLGTPGGGFCSRGVEDWTIGQQRAAAFSAASSAAGLHDQPGMQNWVGDYVQVADSLLPQTDPYWSSDPGANQPSECWDGFTADGSPLTDPTERYNTCYQIFGAPGGSASLARDFPIVAAYDTSLILTRFNYPKSASGGDASAGASIPPSTSNRQITVRDPTNVPALKQLACCFHNQMIFNVRAGGEWITTGTQSGYLHHMTRDPATQRCVTSCDPEKALLNARAIGIAPSSSPDAGVSSFIPDRDSPLAMRNPMFAFFIQHPWLPDPNLPVEVQATAPMVVGRPPRDDVWQFGIRGELTPLSVNLAATNTSVSPQSMLFIPSLGQLAVVDGSQNGQGLILIDLNTVSITGNSYY